MTYFWIKKELEVEQAAGHKADYSHSLIVQTTAPKELGHLRASDAEEFDKSKAK